MINLDEIFSDPFLLILVGNIGTGKSTISKYINLKFKSTLLNCDEFKEENKELNSTELNIKYYLLIEKELMNQRTVILDGQHLKKKYRSKWIKLAHKYKLRVIAIDCGGGDLQSLARRLDNNRGESDEVWKQEYENSKIDYESPTKEEGFDFILKGHDINIGKNYS